MHVCVIYVNVSPTRSLCRNIIFLATHIDLFLTFLLLVEAPDRRLERAFTFVMSVTGHIYVKIDIAKFLEDVSRISIMKPT
jgi:hypothetical protein